MTAALSVGALRDRLLVQRESRTPDGMGGFNNIWVDEATIWAHAKTPSARERFYHGEVQHTDDVVFTIRAYQPLVIDERAVNERRIIHRGKIFRINTASRVDYRLNYYELRCQMWGAVEEHKVVTPPGFFDGSFTFDGSITFSGP